MAMPDAHLVNDTCKVTGIPPRGLGWEVKRTVNCEGHTGRGWQECADAWTAGFRRS